MAVCVCVLTIYNTQHFKVRVEGACVKNERERVRE